MSSGCSANQFDSAFRSQRLQNWCVTKPSKERPTAKHGHTTFIANDRGHLLPMVKRGSTWPAFQGTWDLPARIPAGQVNPTGRSVEGLNRLKLWGFDPQQPGKSQPHSYSKTSDRLQFQISVDAQQNCAAPSSTAEARPASQNRPVSGGETATSQNQDSQAAAVGSIAQSAEDNQAAAGEETTSTPQLVKGRPASNLSAGSGAPSSSK